MKIYIRGFSWKWALFGRLRYRSFFSSVKVTQWNIIQIKEVIWRVGLADSDGIQRQLTERTQLLACAHTHTYISTKTDRMPQRLSWGRQAVSSVQPAWKERRKGGADRGPNTQKLRVTTTHIQSWTGVLAGTKIPWILLNTHSEVMLLTNTLVKGTPMCQKKKKKPPWQ